MGKPARTAEKEACAQRQAVFSEYARAEKEHLKMEEAKTCAMQRLMTEEYIPDQVEQAYKRSRGIEEEEEAAAIPVAQPSHLPTHRLRAKTAPTESSSGSGGGTADEVTRRVRLTSKTACGATSREEEKQEVEEEAE